MKTAFTWRPRLLEALTYGIYASYPGHQVARGLALAVNGTAWRLLRPGIHVGGLAGVSILAALLSWRVLERPLHDLKERLTHRGVVPQESRTKWHRVTEDHPQNTPPVAPADDITAINQRNYENPAIVGEYVMKTLRPAEVMIFTKYRDEITGRRVLDIGCGAGRVTRYLGAWTQHCTGIDFSQAMIEYCRREFPHMAFARCDVRNLTQFRDGNFDVAVFSFNGMDTLRHEDRLAALAGVRRILGVNGLYIFSSHNRRFRDARRGPQLRFSFNPATLARHVMQFGRSVANRSVRKRMEREEVDYAVINDIAHDYSMLHYYIDREKQGAQLAGSGFELLETYRDDGEVLKTGDDDSMSPELYYVARKV